MDKASAEIIALKATSFVMGHDALRDRFQALSGLGSDDIRQMVQETGFLAGIIEFLMGFEPDLVTFAEDMNMPPEDVAKAWHALGGSEGSDW